MSSEQISQSDLLMNSLPDQGKQMEVLQQHLYNSREIETLGTSQLNNQFMQIKINK